MNWRRIAIAAVSLCVLLHAGVTTAAPKYKKPVIIEFHGPITYRLESYFERQLNIAKKRGCDLVIVDIDSPGGYVEPSLNLAARLRDIDWAHTVAWVPREALSGAAIVSLGCDDIYMLPTAVFGDAGPIFLDPDFAFRHAPEKYRSDLARKVRDLAEAKGRPPALAEAMVDLNLVVYEMTHKGTGKVRYMSDPELASAEDADQWTKGLPVQESRKEKFLEVNGKRAVELTMAQGNAADQDDLEKQFELAGNVPVLRKKGVDTAVWLLNLPIITGLLIVIGIIALYVEFCAPGISVGGLVAFLCFALFFWSRFLGGTAGLLEVTLFIAGVVFIVVEVFVIPGFGVSGLTGILLIISSIILASQHFIIPRSDHDWDTLGSSLVIVVLSFFFSMVGAFAIAKTFGSIPLLNSVALQPPEPMESTRSSTPAEMGIAIGAKGKADCALRPAGKARFGKHTVDVITEGKLVENGQPVVVVDMQGNQIVVAVDENPEVV